MKIRLDKMLSHMGYGSRKDVKKIIHDKQVRINGIIINKDDYKVDTDNDDILVYDENVNYLEEVYIMLNKPAGVISATFDTRLPTVIDLMPEYRNYKIFPVGRLDNDSVGLLLLTNNGKLAYNLLSPKSHVDKDYDVIFEGFFNDESIKMFNDGIILEDGYKTLPSKVRIISDNEAIITIHEGKFHQVKRMFAALNMKVIKLKRIRFGNLSLDKNLKEGEYRLLNEKEIACLKDYGKENIS